MKKLDGKMRPYISWNCANVSLLYFLFHLVIVRMVKPMIATIECANRYTYAKRTNWTIVVAKGSPFKPAPLKGQINRAAFIAASTVQNCSSRAADRLEKISETR